MGAGSGEDRDRIGVRVNLGPLEERAEWVAEQIALRVRSLPEPAMRGAVLAERLAALPAALAAHVLADIVQRGRRGGPPFDVTLAALEWVLREERIPYERLVAMYRVCKRDALGEVAILLLPGRQPRDVLEAAERPLPGGRRELTLGERKSLARAAPRHVIDGLLRDPEPQVIRLLLRNPRLVERDVVGLVARRPLGREVALEVLASPRWSVRYAVRRALVLNPTLSDEIALRVLGLLGRGDLREVAQDPALPAVRRRAAVALLRDE